MNKQEEIVVYASDVSVSLTFKRHEPVNVVLTIEEVKQIYAEAVANTVAVKEKWCFEFWRDRMTAAAFSGDQARAREVLDEVLHPGFFEQFADKHHNRTLRVILGDLANAAGI